MLPLCLMAIGALVSGLTVLLAVTGAAGLAGIAVMFASLFATMPIGKKMKATQARMAKSQEGRATMCGLQQADSIPARGCDLVATCWL